MKSGIELIAEERSKGYNHLDEEDFPADFKKANKAVILGYMVKDNRRLGLLIKIGALVAAEIDRLQSAQTATLKEKATRKDVSHYEDLPRMTLPDVFFSPIRNNDPLDGDFKGFGGGDFGGGGASGSWDSSSDSSSSDSGSSDSGGSGE